MNTKATFLPRRETAQGQPRHVGFELEFGGLTFRDCLTTLKDNIEGDCEEVSSVEAEITHPVHGAFRLELDWQFLKNFARDRSLDPRAIDMMAEIAGTVVPMELVLPPLAFEEIDSADAIIKALRSAGAHGTAHSPLYAFGVHINTEIPALDAATLVRYLTAYCILQDYLVVAHRVDASRRLAPWIQPYGPDYIANVLDYGEPSFEELIDDYLAFNPTRNRALDLLPIFAEVDEPRVRRTLPEEKINPRPAFHYRLANSEVDNPDWHISTEWNRWCLVERLADSNAELGALAHEYRRRLRADTFATDAKWVDYMTSWLRQSFDER
ncbi:MAG: amidoligase family protein [Pseudomonadales bacterium]|nr:amidoligase family protein [Pseudomonadales bacterium]